MSALRAILLMLQLLGALDGDSLQPASRPPEVVVRLTARRLEYRPALIVLQRGVSVVLELESEDQRHGFSVPELALRADVVPGTVTRLRFTPDAVGRFEFRCDASCGSGHADMAGAIVVMD